MTHVRFEVREITPDIAQEWLMRSRNKVKLDRRAVSAFGRDMAAGLWKLNGEPIIFSKQDQLLTGRTRLAACLESRASFPALVVLNVDETHFETIDAVRRRTVADVLTIRREADGRALASALTVLWRYANKDLVNARRRVSASSLLGILQENPEIRTSLRLTRDIRRIIPHGVACALHYLFSRVSAEQADKFFQALLEQQDEGSNAAVLLRRQLDEVAQRGGWKAQAFLAGLTIKAWEAFTAGKRGSLLRYSLENDEFPTISKLPDNLRLDGVVRAAGDPFVEQSQPADAITVRIEDVTPERAAELLARNDGNRRIASAVVDKYARDIKAGEWKLNGQTIKLGRSGRLLDGQHRCAAAIKARRGFESIVVDGLDDQVFDTFDLGAKRAIGDILIDRRETNTSTLAATLRQLWLINNDLLQHGAVSPTVSELLDTLERHPGIRDSVRMASRIRDIIAPSLGCALHYVFRLTDREKADEFLTRLGDGLYLDGMNNPIWKLRKRLLDDRASKKRGMPDVEKAAITIKAWNAYYNSAALLNLKWQNAGPKREEFPSIAGRALREEARDV